MLRKPKITSQTEVYANLNILSREPKLDLPDIEKILAGYEMPFSNEAAKRVVREVAKKYANQLLDLIESQSFDCHSEGTGGLIKLVTGDKIQEIRDKLNESH